ncbi:unnamed protein product [Symbiodinium microadriaticum]|nr:unnamed protein product [Symbiodinium microadriaticum]
MEQLEEEQEAQLLPKKYAEHQAVKEQLAAREEKLAEGAGAICKLYCIPRNAEQCVEIQVREGSRQVRWDWVGPNFGKVGCKYISICRSLVTPGEFYCVPYDAAHVLLVNIDEDTITEVGEKVSSDLVTKYATAASSYDWNGRIYAAPFLAQRVLQIDPYTGTVGEVGPRLVKSEQGEWWVTIASPITLKIYAIPWDARHVMEIDPVRGGATRKVGPDLGPTPGKYCSAIVAGDGSIFAPPYNARKILRIDGTGNVSLVPPDLGVGPRKYCCMCQGANRLLYAPPLYADQVLEISTSGKGNRLIGPAIGNGEAKYACAALGPDHKIYCAPLEAHRVLLIIPEDHEVEEIGVDLGKEEEKYSCIAPAPVGPMMYAAPRNARFLLEVDTKRCFVREVGKDLGPVKRKFTAILTGKPPEAPALVRSGTAPQRGAGASWSPPSSRSKQRTPPQDQKAVEPRSLMGVLRLCASNSMLTKSKPFKCKTARQRTMLSPMSPARPR